jgi:hypothetical protein
MALMIYHIAGGTKLVKCCILPQPMVCGAVLPLTSAGHGISAVRQSNPGRFHEDTIVYLAQIKRVISISIKSLISVTKVE